MVSDMETEVLSMFSLLDRRHFFDLTNRVRTRSFRHFLRLTFVTWFSLSPATSKVGSQLVLI